MTPTLDRIPSLETAGAGRSKLRGVCWNWKSALLSSLFRGMIFFFANMSAGLHAASGALFAEFCYRALTSGFYGGITQSLTEVQPAWMGSAIALLVLPVCSHSLELAVHLMRHTPKLASSLTASVCFTVLSTLFHLYAMRRGALVVQAGASSLAQDIIRMPRLIIAFLSEGPLFLFRCVKCFARAGGLRRHMKLRASQSNEIGNRRLLI